MFDPDLLTAMPHTVGLLPLDSVDQYGRRTYQAPIQMTCYWLQENSVSEDPEGQRATTSGMLYIAPSAYWPVPQEPEFAPTTDMGVLLPTATPKTVQIGKVSVYRDADGVIGYEVAYG